MNIMSLESTPKFSFLLLAASNDNMEDMQTFKVGKIYMCSGNNFVECNITTWLPHVVFL